MFGVIEKKNGLDLTQMKLVDVRTVKRDELADIAKVQVNKNLPEDKRFADFLEQVKNPYCYRCGKVVVKVSFADTGVPWKTVLNTTWEAFLVKTRVWIAAGG